MPNESQIRDKLASNLSVLEPGLILVGTEVRLDNPLGAKGFVDILAKDAMGNRVVIEIKRSDASARAALHEIYKYLAILQIEQAIPSHKIRCFLVSTDWHELLVPFSEFARTSPYQVEGRRIWVDEAGNVTSVGTIIIQEAPQELTLFRHHDILLFTTISARDAAISEATAALDKAGSQLAFLLSLEYAGDNPHVIYPFALYVAVARAAPAVLDSLREKLIDEGDLPDDISDIERELILAQAFSGIYLEQVSSHDTYEIGSPEKYTGLRLRGWNLSTMRRHGPGASRLGFTDEEIHTLIAGKEGQNQVMYHRISSPKLHASWTELNQKAIHTLIGNETWEQDFRLFIELASTEYRTNNVAIRIYNPVQTIFWIIKLLRDGDRRYLPELEFIVSAGDNNIAYLYGFIENWRAPNVKTVHELLAGIALDPFDLLIRYQFGIGWKQDSEIMARMGLRYTSVLLRHQQGSDRSIETFSAGRPPWKHAWQNNFSRNSVIQGYWSENTEFLEELLTAFSDVITAF